MATPPSGGSDLPEIDGLWNFGDPAASEEAFRAVLPAAEGAAEADPVSGTAYLVTLWSQIARTHGLRRDFETAHALLDRSEAALVDRPQAPELRARPRMDRHRAGAQSELRWRPRGRPAPFPRRTRGGRSRRRRGAAGRRAAHAGHRRRGRGPPLERGRAGGGARGHGPQGQAMARIVAQQPGLVLSRSWRLRARVGALRGGLGLPARPRPGRPGAHRPVVRGARLALPRPAGGGAGRAAGAGRGAGGCGRGQRLRRGGDRRMPARARPRGGRPCLTSSRPTSSCPRMPGWRPRSRSAWRDSRGWAGSRSRSNRSVSSRPLPAALGLCVRWLRWPRPTPWRRKGVGSAWGGASPTRREAVAPPVGVLR